MKTMIDLPRRVTCIAVATALSALANAAIAADTEVRLTFRNLDVVSENVIPRLAEEYKLGRERSYPTMKITNGGMCWNENSDEYARSYKLLVQGITMSAPVNEDSVDFVIGDDNSITVKWDLPRFSFRGHFLFDYWQSGTKFGCILPKDLDQETLSFSVTGLKARFPLRLSESSWTVSHADPPSFEIGSVDLEGDGTLSLFAAGIVETATGLLCGSAAQCASDAVNAYLQSDNAAGLRESMVETVQQALKSATKIADEQTMPAGEYVVHSRLNRLETAGGRIRADYVVRVRGDSTQSDRCASGVISGRHVETGLSFGKTERDADIRIPYQLFDRVAHVAAKQGRFCYSLTMPGGTEITIRPYDRISAGKAAKGDFVKFDVPAHVTVRRSGSPSIDRDAVLRVLNAVTLAGHKVRLDLIHVEVTNFQPVRLGRTRRLTAEDLTRLLNRSLPSSAKSLVAVPSLTRLPDYGLTMTVAEIQRPNEGVSLGFEFE